MLGKQACYSVLSEEYVFCTKHVAVVRKLSLVLLKINEVNIGVNVASTQLIQLYELIKGAMHLKHMPRIT